MSRHGIAFAALASLALCGRAEPPAEVPAFAHPPQDRNGTMLYGEPLLDPPATPPGWFAGLEVDIVGPAIKQRVRGQVSLGDALVNVQLPTATLDWTGAPRLEVGYRLPEAVGELLVAYRPLATAGSGTIADFDAAGNGVLKSRLDAHVTFLDYASREFGVWPQCDMKAHVGVCVPTIYFDSRVVGSLREARISSYYFGAGPHLGFDFWRRSPIEGLDLYGRLEGVITFGHVQQRFTEARAASGAAAVSDFSSVQRVREVPMGHVEAGLSYTAPWTERRLRLLAGYTLERWWYVAQTETSFGELTVQGLFLRAEWGY